MHPDQLTAFLLDDHLFSWLSTSHCNVGPSHPEIEHTPRGVQLTAINLQLTVEPAVDHPSNSLWVLLSPALPSVLKTNQFFIKKVQKSVLATNHPPYCELPRAKAPSHSSLYSWYLIANSRCLLDADLYGMVNR